MKFFHVRIWHLKKLNNVFHHIDILCRFLILLNITIRLFWSICSLRDASKNRKRLDLTISKQQKHLISVHYPKRWFQILLNCEKQQFVSYMFNLLEQMYNFSERTMLFQRKILNFQDLSQNQSLETITVCIVQQYYEHGNIVCIHKHDEYIK